VEYGRGWKYEVMGGGGGLQGGARTELAGMGVRGYGAKGKGKRGLWEILRGC
jgi:hypothetical protein